MFAPSGGVDVLGAFASASIHRSLEVAGSRRHDVPLDGQAQWVE